MKNFRKGFTLIELLVVIAIVGLLASVVLASLQSARNKAADAKVKETLAQLRSQAELFLSNNGVLGYAGLDSDTQTIAIYNSAQASGADYDGDGVVDNTDGGIGVCTEGNSPYWYAWVRLKGDTGTVWYVDGTGKSEVRTLVPTSPLTVSGCTLS